MHIRLVVVALLFAPCVCAQEITGVYGRLEAGGYWRHTGEFSGGGGYGGGLRVGWPRKRSLVEIGAAFAGDGARHIQTDIAVILPRRLSEGVRTWVGLQGGLMTEDEYCGPWAAAAAGLDVQLTRQLGVYLVGRYGMHLGADGPSMIGVGLLLSPH